MGTTIAIKTRTVMIPSLIHMRNVRPCAAFKPELQAQSSVSRKQTLTRMRASAISFSRPKTGPLFGPNFESVAIIFFFRGHRGDLVDDLWAMDRALGGEGDIVSSGGRKVGARWVRAAGTASDGRRGTAFMEGVGSRALPRSTSVSTISGLRFSLSRTKPKYDDSGI